MAVITVADVLSRVEEFERALAGFYARLSQGTDHDGVRLLASYMSRQRPRVTAVLNCLPSEHITTICSTLLRYEPYGADCRCFDNMELPVHAPAAEVLDIAVNFNECLVRFFRQVTQQPADEQVVELFESFIRLEHREEIELKKIRAMHYF